jgi:hypothetical protein
MAKKVKDLAVATGTYSDGYGQEKRRYMNCGALMENDEGGQFLMLNRYINYAALPNPKGGESILISVFDLREKSSGDQAVDVAAPARAEDLDDEVPF